jgi:uncharacterized membrane protein YeaQ/YmgE (transglycosylase-associated protein family)
MTRHYHLFTQDSLSQPLTAIAISVVCEASHCGQHMAEQVIAAPMRQQQQVVNSIMLHITGATMAEQVIPATVSSMSVCLIITGVVSALILVQNLRVFC